MSSPTKSVHPAIADVLARRGAVLAAVTPTSGVVESDDRSEPIFGVVGPMLRMRGWSVYPQTRRGSRRMPCVVDGRTLLIKPLATALPSFKDVDWWAVNCPRENVAAVMGKATGVFAVDVDVTDRPLAERIIPLLLEALGPAFIRMAGEAKATLYYRLDPADPVDASRKLPVLDGEGKPTGHAVEVLANGASSTVWGRHHRTGNRFRFGSISPLRDPKERAAAVTKAALQAALDRIDTEIVRLGAIRPFDRRQGFVATGEVEGAAVDASGLVRPGGRTSIRSATYVDGKVVDGREVWLRDRAVAYCLANTAMAATDAGRRALAASLAEEASRTWDGLGSQFKSAEAVLGAALQRICSGSDFVARTPDLLRRVGREESGRPLLVQRVAVKIQRDETIAGLSWLTDDLLGSVSLKDVVVTDQEQKARERALVSDLAIRQADQERVASAVRASVDRWIDEAYVRAGRDDAPLKPIQVLKAPTGAGKTSTLIERIAEAKRRRGPAGKPVLILMPSYNNIEESIARARGKRADVTALFKASAAAATNDAEGLGLDVGILTGRERGGCRMSEHLSLLRAAKIPASGLCSGDDEDAIERVERLKANRARNARKAAGEPAGPRETAPKVFCHHHPNVGGDCPLILARRELRERDVVFAPLAFITNAFPGELKDAFAGVAIDERVVFELLHHATMPIATLSRERAAPPVLESDGEQTGEGFLAERAAVARIALDALSRGEDVANAIMAHADGERMRACVKSAVTVTGRGQRAAREIKPNMALGILKQIVSVPQAADIREEAKFWRLVDERLEALEADRLTRDLAGGSPDPAMLKARGPRDMRVQAVAEGMLGKESPPSIRLSWRAVPNLADLPLLLLDASADVAMVRKVWSGREVEAVEIPAYLHLRTLAVLDAAYSTSSLDPSGVADPKAARRIAERVVKVRRAENTVAHVYGQGRVLTVAPRRVRKALRLAYAETDNVDTGHYGAMRGLDFARQHMAVMTVGRHEFPTWIVDALAAALTYDDDEPELPYDVNGDGVDPATKAEREPNVVERTYKLRDGRDLRMNVSEMPGRWGRAVQRQFREEEQLQAAGRLRPVYREGEPPLWVCMSKVMPEDVIIDGVTNLNELSNPRGGGLVLDAIRRVGLLDMELLARQAPDLRGVHGIPGMLRRLELDQVGAQTPFGAGLDHYAVTVDGEERSIGVPAYHADGVSAVVEAYDRSGMRVGGVRLVAKGSDPQPSMRKTPDKVDAEIGTRHERFAAEESARNEAIEAKRKDLLSDPWNRLETGGPLLDEPGRQDVAVAVVIATQASVIPEEPEPGDEPAAPLPTPCVPQPDEPAPEPRFPASPARLSSAPGWWTDPKTGVSFGRVPCAPRGVVAPGLPPPPPGW